MSEPFEKLKNPPIIEAVVDIDCDLPPSHDLVARATQAKEAFAPQYPISRETFIHPHRIEASSNAAQLGRGPDVLIAYHFSKDDEKQLVQMRPLGFTFNRLAPYSALDDYLKTAPRLPGPEDALRFVSFFNQHSVIEMSTQNRANIILANQPVEGDKLPILFDISAERAVAIDDPLNWPAIAQAIASLRRLKNTIFWDTVKLACVNLYQQ